MNAARKRDVGRAAWLLELRKNTELYRGRDAIDAPLLNGSSAYTNPVPPLETMQLAAAAQEGRVLPALRCLLVEVRNFA